MQGVMGDELLNMGVLATDENTIGLGTVAGFFVSTDSGKTFQEVVENLQVTAILFDRHSPQCLFGLEEWRTDRC